MSESSMKKTYEQRILSAYPGAEPFSTVVSYLQDELESNGYQIRLTRPATLMCVDCHVSQAITRELDGSGFLSTFSLRQLGGYPRIEGEEGIVAYTHQLVNEGGNQPGLLIYAPHTAFSEDREGQGIVRRKGRTGHGKSCGARVNLIKRLKGEIPPPDPFYNRGGQVLYEDFLPEREKILEASNPDSYQLELQYERGRSQLLEMLYRVQGAEEERHDILVVMGVQIDTDTYLDKESFPHYFQLREIAWLRADNVLETVYQLNDSNQRYY